MKTPETRHTTLPGFFLCGTCGASRRVWGTMRAYRLRGAVSSVGTKGRSPAGAA